MKLTPFKFKVEESQTKDEQTQLDNILKFCNDIYHKHILLDDCRNYLCRFGLVINAIHRP